MEQKIKALLGELSFTILMLQAQIEELKKPKETDDKN